MANPSDRAPIAAAAIIAQRTTENTERAIDAAMRKYNQESNVYDTGIQSHKLERNIEQYRAERGADAEKLLVREVAQLEVEVAKLVEAGKDAEANAKRQELNRVRANGVGDDNFDKEGVTQLYTSTLQDITSEIGSMTRDEMNNTIIRMQNLMGAIETSDSSEKDFLQTEYKRTLDFLQAEHKKRSNIMTRAMTKASELGEQYLDISSLYAGFVDHNPVAMALFRFGGDFLRRQRENKKAQKEAITQDRARAAYAEVLQNTKADDANLEAEREASIQAEKESIIREQAEAASAVIVPNPDTPAPTVTQDTPTPEVSPTPIVNVDAPTDAPTRVERLSTDSTELQRIIREGAERTESVERDIQRAVESYNSEVGSSERISSSTVSDAELERIVERYAAIQNSTSTIERAERDSDSKLDRLVERDSTSDNSTDSNLDRIIEREVEPGGFGGFNFPEDEYSNTGDGAPGEDGAGFDMSSMFGDIEVEDDVDQSAFERIQPESIQLPTDFADTGDAPLERDALSSLFGGPVEVDIDEPEVTVIQRDSDNQTGGIQAEHPEDHTPQFERDNGTVEPVEYETAPVVITDQKIPVPVNITQIMDAPEPSPQFERDSDIQTGGIRAEHPEDHTPQFERDNGTVEYETAPVIIKDQKSPVPVDVIQQAESPEVQAEQIFERTREDEQDRQAAELEKANSEFQSGTFERLDRIAELIHDGNKELSKLEGNDRGLLSMFAPMAAMFAGPVLRALMLIAPAVTAIGALLSKIGLGGLADKLTGGFDGLTDKLGGDSQKRRDKAEQRRTRGSRGGKFSRIAGGAKDKIGGLVESGKTKVGGMVRGAGSVAARALPAAAGIGSTLLGGLGAILTSAPAMVAGAGAAGYGAGTLINDHVIGKEGSAAIGDTIGPAIDNVLSFFGSDEATHRLETIEKLKERNSEVTLGKTPAKVEPTPTMKVVDGSTFDMLTPTVAGTPGAASSSFTQIESNVPGAIVTDKTITATDKASNVTDKTTNQLNTFQRESTSGGNMIVQTKKLEMINNSVASVHNQRDRIEVPVAAATEARVERLSQSVTELQVIKDKQQQFAAQPQSGVSAPSKKSRVVAGDNGSGQPLSMNRSARNSDSSIERLTDRFVGMGMM